LSDKYDEAIKSLNIGPIYYVTELIDNYSYDFTSSSVKIDFGQTNKYNYLDVYTEGGVSRNYMTRGLESAFNPEFRISNIGNIPRLFAMPVNTAEKSFAQRKGTYKDRPAFKLRYYFKFWQCDSKFGTENFGGYRCDVEVVKVELIDDIVNYKKAYDVEPGEQPAGAQNNSSSNNSNSNTNNDSSNNNQETNTEADKGMLYGNIGWKAFERGELDKCVELSKKALTFNPNLCFIKFNIALVHLIQEKDEALDEYVGAIADIKDDKTPKNTLSGAIEDIRNQKVKTPNLKNLKDVEDLLFSEYKKY
ncbi:MAG: hypothetical protein Q8N05_00315, partial [Bacteroidota bacterium]|nr:hypothetical protein [Bacteroidota bacterium]